MAFLAPALPFLAAGASLLQGVGGFMASQSNKKALRRQQREEADATRDAELDLRSEARKAIGAQLAAQYSNGMVGGTGTALDAIRESLVNAAVDARRIRQQGASRSDALERRAKMESRAGYFDLAGALIGAGTSYEKVRSDWAQASVGANAGLVR